MPIAILRTLEHLTVSSFIAQIRDPIIRLEPTSCVRDALMTFTKQKVLSCPVSNTRKAEDTQGFLDLFDLLSYLLELWEENTHATTNRMAELGKKFLNHTVCDLTDRSDNDIFAAVVLEENADKLVRLFGLGVHRVVLLEKQGRMSDLLSQSDVVKYLHVNQHLLGGLGDKTIEELNMISYEKLIVATGDQSAISSFKLLASNLISAVPIIDSQGSLMGTLSLSDLKLLQDDLSPLLISTSEYKSMSEPISSVTCKLDTTLRTVISMLADSNVHRVWVVDEKQKPTAVISITNVCELLSRHFPPEDEDVKNF